MAVVTGRYARAFAEVIAAHQGDAGKAVEELEQMASLVDGSHELRNVFQNPAVAQKQKISLLDEIIEKMGGSRLLRNFLAVLIDQHRIGQIAEIARQFKQDLDARMGIAEAKVSSARELTAAEKKSLEKELAATTGKTIRATYAEDATLLGGAIVRVGSTIYDGSVRGRLEKMKEQISGA
ncbi:MAG: ATP synthase F1 subunit delta [Acidobacteriia bacterium]|nr:ATP synthase F1 subunit delta [Terriglobia bacterium]